jgi:hypothetical protein
VKISFSPFHIIITTIAAAARIHTTATRILEREKNIHK